MLRLRTASATAAVVTSLLLTAGNAFAINGLLFYGLGAKNRAMGGAGAAAALDTSTILINPAGLSDIGRTADLGAHLLRARRNMDTTNANPLIVNTAAGDQQSKQEYYMTPFSGLAYKADDSKWSFGGMIAGVAGEGASYNQSRTQAGAAGNYDKQSFLFIIKGIPAVAYDVTDKLTVGAGVHINAALFSADIATATLAQTEGDGRLEIAYGVGAQVGATYDINERWSVGGSVTSKQYFEDFGLYVDLIPNFRLPPEARIGLSYKPTPKLLLAADYKWIGWEEVALFNDKPTEGGFGWKNQHVINLGAQYGINSAWIVRAGFNYAYTNIKEESTFANALVPTVYETHLAAGAEYRIGKHNSIAFSVVRTLPNSQTDDGSGDTFSQLGKGTKIGYDGWDADLQWSINF